MLSRHPSPGMKKPAPWDRSLGAMAEEEGFEPSYPRRGKRFSRPPHSTTLPPLRRVTWRPKAPRKVLAESQGFEPWRRFRRLHDFQSCSFGHSDNSPCNAALASIAYAPAFGKTDFRRAAPGRQGGAAAGRRGGRKTDFCTSGWLFSPGIGNRSTRLPAVMFFLTAFPPGALVHKSFFMPPATMCNNNRALPRNPRSRRARDLLLA